MLASHPPVGKTHGILRLLRFIMVTQFYKPKFKFIVSYCCWLRYLCLMPSKMGNVLRREYTMFVTLQYCTRESRSMAQISSNPSRCDVSVFSHSFHETHIVIKTMDFPTTHETSSIGRWIWLLVGHIYGFRR